VDEGDDGCDDGDFRCEIVVVVDSGHDRVVLLLLQEVVE